MLNITKFSKSIGINSRNRKHLISATKKLGKWKLGKFNETIILGKTSEYSLILGKTQKNNNKTVKPRKSH